VAPRNDDKANSQGEVMSSPPSTRIARGGEGSGVWGGAAFTAAAVPADRPPTPDPSPPLRGGRGEDNPHGGEPAEARRAQVGVSNHEATGEPAMIAVNGKTLWQ